MVAGVLFITLVVVAIHKSSFVEQFKPFIPALQEGVESHSSKYNCIVFSDETTVSDINAIHRICKQNCNKVQKLLPISIPGVATAFQRFCDGLFLTLKHLLDKNTLTRTAFKNLINPMAILIYTISGLTGYGVLKNSGQNF